MVHAYIRWHLWNGNKIIEYISEDGRFLLSASCVTTSNPELFSSSERRVNTQPWNTQLRKALVCNFISQNHWLHIFHKEVRSWDSTKGFRIWIFKHWFRSGISKASSGLFWGMSIGVFLKRESRLITYLTALTLPRNSPTFFSVFTYSLIAEHEFVQSCLSGLSYSLKNLVLTTQGGHIRAPNTPSFAVPRENP
jgi:hypothetical protein